MSLDFLIAPMTRLIQLWDNFIHVQGVKPSLDILRFLFAISGAFWFLSKACGWIAVQIHESLDHSLAELLAVVYNTILGLAFSVVLCEAILREKGNSDYFLAYQAAGFTFIYIVLGAVYSERSGEISEYALLGYGAGLASYLLFSIHNHFLAHPLAQRAYEAISFVIHGRVGRIVAWLSVFQWTSFIVRRIRRFFFWKSAKIWKWRFFFNQVPGFSLAPN